MADTSASGLSLACATGQHHLCRGYWINPDPDAPADKLTLPCQCTEQVKHKREHTAEQGKTTGRGRGRGSGARR
ncbi:hypothetical protein [Thermobispora bispora]|uniref:hypothetical protein n=1 Tax=Thermobispora bispora TaxID=2006 RepID=UPI00197CC361|nr:hypothetical protein [Thermobispora bispora]QSI50006.1 hypothetical protein CYL17_18715 [Thermobispora bispora]